MTTEPRASRTAEGVAFLRAVHQVLDAAPLILNDPVIVRLVPADALQAVREDPARVESGAARGLRAHVVLRSRFAEDRLEAAVRLGVTQTIVLGAGYDTFAYRQPEWARSIRVIEVDQPATQARKRAALAAAHVDIPANVYFADVDFERESLREGLTRHGISLDAPSFFSWLGVTMYLTEPAIDAVLETVVSCPPPSEIVFTFAPPREPPGPDDPPSLAERAAALGEPWLTYFEPADLERKLRAMGFSTVEFLTPEQSGERYFRDRADRLPAPRRTTIVSARR